MLKLSCNYIILSLKNSPYIQVNRMNNGWLSTHLTSLLLTIPSCSWSSWVSWVLSNRIIFWPKSIKGKFGRIAKRGLNCLNLRQMNVWGMRKVLIPTKNGMKKTHMEIWLQPTEGQYWFWHGYIVWMVRDNRYSDKSFSLQASCDNNIPTSVPCLVEYQMMSHGVIRFSVVEEFSVSRCHTQDVQLELFEKGWLLWG